MIPKDSIPAGTPVLVTGATGFTGSVLTRKLVARGFQVRAIARGSSDTGSLSDLDVRWYRGDVYDPSLVAEATRNVQYIFHLAACYRDPKASADEYTRVHLDSTKLLARNVVGKPDFQCFVHTSTVGVHGHISNPPANEEYPFSPGDIYQKTKLEAELWLREFAPDQGLPFTVLRPAAILGPGDRRLLKLFKLAKRGWCPLLGGHNTLYHLIHVEDLTDVYLAAAVHPAARGEVFICGNETPTDLRSIVSTVGQFFGKKVCFVNLPARPMFLLADACEGIFVALNLSPILYRRRLAFFTKDRAFETEKLRKLLDFHCRFDNTTGLLDTAEGYLEAGWIQR